MTDEVDLDEPGAVPVPFGPGADRDLGLQQRPGLGVRAAREPGDCLRVLKAPDAAAPAPSPDASRSAPRAGQGSSTSPPDSPAGTSLPSGS